MDDKPKLYEDVIFNKEANRFRTKGDNAEYLRKRLADLGYDDQAELVDKIRLLKRPSKASKKDPIPAVLFAEKYPPFPRGKRTTTKFTFDIPDEHVDAVEWLESLGALRLDKHFQCLWAACAVVVATEGWQTDKIVRRGRRWMIHPPELPRAAFLLRWDDFRDASRDWNEHLDRLRRMRATTGVNDYLRTQLREQSFMNRIMPPVPTQTHNQLDQRVEAKMEFIQMLRTNKGQ